MSLKTHRINVVLEYAYNRYITEDEFNHNPTGATAAHLPEGVLSSLITRACDYINRRVNMPILKTQTVSTYTLPGGNVCVKRDGSLLVMPRYRPLISVDGVRIKYLSTGAAWNIVDLLDAIMVEENGIKKFLVPGAFGSYNKKAAVEVTYTSGYAEVPPALKEGVIMAIACWIQPDYYPVPGPSGGGTIIPGVVYRELNKVVNLFKRV